MAATRFSKSYFAVLLLLFVFFFQFAAPEISPSPPPSQLGLADSPLSSPPNAGSPSFAPAPVTGSPISSPPSPPPETQAPTAPVSTPASSPPSPDSDESQSPVPTPSPSDLSDINHKDLNAEGFEPEDSSGISGGKKAGIAFGVIAAACLVGLGGFVYKKRQANMRRSQYGYAARREML